MRRKEGASPARLWRCCRASCWGRWRRGYPGGQGWTWGPTTVSPGSSNVPRHGLSELGRPRGLCGQGVPPSPGPSGPGGATTIIHCNFQAPSTLPQPRGQGQGRVPPKHQAAPCPQSPRGGCLPGQPHVPGHARAPTLQHYRPGAAPGVQQTLLSTEKALISQPPRSQAHPELPGARRDMALPVAAFLGSVPPPNPPRALSGAAMPGWASPSLIPLGAAPHILPAPRTSH